MTRLKAKSFIEITTNIAVLLMAIIVITFFIHHYLTQRKQPTPINLKTGFQKGQLFPQLQNINYAKSAKTLLIVLNIKCSFCTEGIPFYNQLADLQNKSKSNVDIIALFPNEEAEVRQYIQQNQIKINHIAKVDFDSLNIGGTPTIILVDSNGKIIDFWLGKLTMNTEQQVIKQVTQL